MVDVKRSIFRYVGDILLLFICVKCWLYVIRVFFYLLGVILVILVGEK